VTASANNSWYVLRSGASAPAHNMAFDDALLESAAAIGKPVLRFYGWTEPAATFGYFQKYADIERWTLLRPLIRRPTGGGLVPHDADWTYSLAFPPSAAWYELSAVESYQRVHEWIRAAFQKLGIITELAPCCRKAMPGQCFAGHEKSDVLWHDRKIAGAAQRRNRNGLLIQGSVQPPPIKVARADWEQAMGDAGAQNFSIIWEELSPAPDVVKRVAELSGKTYSQASYNQQR
jgi:lipoate-protein ligase A